VAVATAVQVRETLDVVCVLVTPVGAAGAVAPLLVVAEYKVGEDDPMLLTAVIEN